MTLRTLKDFIIVELVLNHEIDLVGLNYETSFTRAVSEYLILISSPVDFDFVEVSKEDKKRLMDRLIDTEGYDDMEKLAKVAMFLPNVDIKWNKNISELLHNLIYGEKQRTNG